MLKQVQHYVLKNNITQVKFVMKAQISHNQKTYNIDLEKPLDISLSLRGDDKNPVAWYLDAPKILPVRNGEFIGKVSEGATTNFNNIQFNPHAHVTHTECVGHITREFHSINNTLKTFFFTARVISVEPEERGEDRVISKEKIQVKLQKNDVEALIIRTIPNYIDKQTRKYSHTNWPYIDENAAIYIRDCGIKHLL